MKQYMQAIIDYTENHIENPISIDDIEQYIGYSRHYLHKLFLIYTGFSVMQYVRQRKMEYARKELSKGSGVLHVAVQYGYQSDRAFRRAFKNYFQMSPSDAKHISYHFPPTLKLDEVGGINMLPYLSEVSKVEITSKYLVGVEKISTFPEGDSIDFMQEYARKNDIQPMTEIGSDIPVSEEEASEQLRGYAQYLVVSKEVFDSVQDETVLKKKQLGSKYLKLTITEPFLNPFERIPTGWKKLFSVLDESYQLNNDVALPCFEEKIEMMDCTVMNLYVAII